MISRDGKEIFYYIIFLSVSKLLWNMLLCLHMNPHDYILGFYKQLVDHS